MSIQKTPLLPGHYYHIYNRGINSCDLFREHTNYEHFLGLYDKYISPVANTMAWVLMKNHFHLVIEILQVECWGELPPPNPEGFGNLRGLEPEKRVYQQFSNLFNAYTKAYNKKYNRTGSLLEHPFRRIKVESMDYLKNLIVYIHQNPVHHGFCNYPMDYPWSSYRTCISLKPTKLNREKVVACFGNTDEFILYHNQQIQNLLIDEWFEI